MRREDLKDLGLESSVIDKVMKLHGQSINKLKEGYADYDEVKAQNKDLTAQVDKSNKDLKDLRGQLKDSDELKGKIKTLEEQNKQAQADSKAKIAQIKLDHAIDNSLANAKARDAQPVKSLFDMDKIKFNDKGELDGLDEQLKAVQESHPYLFDKGSKGDYKPGGRDDNNDAGSTQNMVDIFKGQTTTE
ncbi:phage scaffolding protein [Apilactobacillus xinyiensis]|uniref:phage scaffolding protein n=1 Tax=Apilactobacillus xinyiensis TaxID=2841032 RepID=UPI00200F8732|nr:phage scaffolding protein [Apilactobacillus xinyiensis]MCL0319376.1 phage scaffolding protein [Apilactobacillus xinyiensis]